MSGDSFTRRVTRIHVLPESEPIFSEWSTEVEIQDESGGEFVVVREIYGPRGANKLRIEPDEWPQIRDAINDMIAACREEGRPTAEEGGAE